MRPIRYIVLAVAGSFLLSGGCAWAQDDQEPLSADALGAISAGQAPQVTVATRQNVDALNGGNTISADTVRDGDVNFSSGAFGGFNGVGNIVVNTGNNNIIQGTLSVTITNGMPQ